MRLYFVVAVLYAFFCSVCVVAATNDDNDDASQLDAVAVEAVQSYVNTKKFEMTIGTGFFPLDPYNFSFSLDAGASLYLNTYLAWEIVQVSYAFNVEKNLRAQLANFGVTPQQLETLQYTVSTNLVLLPVYGKSVLFGNILQYFRTAFLAGPALVKTSLNTDLSLSLGVRMESYLNETFSYRLEIRDNIVFAGGENFASINIGVGAYF